MDVFEAIQKRRSVRVYKDAAIPKADLEKIVDAGHLAPSGGNRQPWDFIVITERSTLEQLNIVNGWMTKAGAVIVVVMDPSSPWWIVDGSVAAENMLIAATALGYGCCLLEGHTHPNEGEVKTLLNIPAERRVLSLIPVGVPVEWPTKEKKPLSEVLRWEKF